MNKTYIILYFLSIIGVFFGIFTGTLIISSLSMLATLIIGVVSAYRYNNEFSYILPFGVILTFIMFLVTAEYGYGIICTLLLFLFYIEVGIFAAKHPN